MRGFKGLNINNDVVISHDSELIHAALDRLLFTEIGSMIGGLDRGSRLLDYMHQNITYAEVIAMIREIKELIQNTEPRIKLNGVGVKMVPDASTMGLIVYLEWEYINNPTQQFTTTLSKVKEF